MNENQNVSPFPIASRSGLTIGGRIADVELWDAATFGRVRADVFDPCVAQGHDWHAIEMGPFVVVIQLVRSDEAINRLVEDGEDFASALLRVADVARNDAAWSTFARPNAAALS